jgi:O-antigen/teichoic acid export membrane protein
MQSLNRYAINTTWLLIEKSTRIVSGLLVGILVARYLGPEQFGMLGYALNIVSVFAILNTLGMESVLVKELIERKNNTANIISTAFILRLIGAVVAILTIAIYTSLRDTNEQVLIVLLVSSFMIFHSFTVIDLFFNAQVKGKYNAISQVITLSISAVIKLLMIKFGFPLPYFAGMLLFESVLAAFIQYRFFSKENIIIHYSLFSFQEALALIKKSLPFILAGFIYYTFLKMDLVLLKRFSGLYEVGIYNAALRISESSLFIVVAITAGVFPALVVNKDASFFKARFTQLVSLLIWISILIIVFGFFTSDMLIELLFKSTFMDASSVFRIHIFSILPVFLITLWSYWITSEGKQKLMIPLYSFTLIIGITLQFKLIPQFAAIGAAWGYVIAQYINLILAFTLYKPKFIWRVALYALNPQNAFAALLYVIGKKH